MADTVPFEPWPDQNVSVSDTARFLGVTDKHIKRLIKDGTLPSYKLGRRRLLRLDEVRAYRDGLRAA
ncbi:MAG: helix-turn-helix domain-containing protein [Pseudomonadota bacterium]